MFKTFPHYSQLNYSDCGPTCLRMIASYYGKEYSPETLRKHYFISRNGVSMLGICDAAEYIGMHVLGMKFTLNQLVTLYPFYEKEISIKLYLSDMKIEEIFL